MSGFDISRGHESFSHPRSPSFAVMSVGFTQPSAIGYVDIMNETTALANVAVIVLTCGISYWIFQNPGRMNAWLFSSKAILGNRQYHRILSSGFIHADMSHLVFNMFSLYSFGSYIELYFGMGTFLLIYFASMIGGNLVSLYLHRHESYLALGASGGVCGIIFASIFLIPGGSVYLFLIPIPIPSWLFAIIFIAFSMYGARNQLGNIGHDAHLGGALVGLFMTTLLYPSIALESPLLYAAIIAITVTMILFFKRKSG